MTTIENEIAVFWRDMLHLDAVKGEDNFFHLGGNSIHAIHLQHFVSKKFKVDISFRSIFENQTVGGLSRVIESKISALGPGHVPGTELVELEANGIDAYGSMQQNGNGSVSVKEPLVMFGKNNPPALVSKENLLPVSYGEESLWLVYQLQANKSVYNEVKAFRIKGELNLLALEKSLRQIVFYHENLRKKFVEVEGALHAYVEDEPDWQLRIVRAKDYAANRFEQLSTQYLIEEINTPFNLGHELPFRATLVDFEGEFLLMLTAHHIVSDEWSFAVLYKDLERLYRAFIRNETIPLPPLATRYRNYAVNGRESLSGGKLQNMLSFWLNYLRGTTERMKLPYDRRVVKSNLEDGQKEGITIPVELVNILNEISRKEGATLFMTFLAAFHCLLYRYSGNEKILTGVPFAGREEDTQHLVGFFANNVLIATDFADDPDFKTVLSRVRNNTLEAATHQSIPFQVLADALRKETGVDASEIIQAMFVFQNASDIELKLEGAACQYVEPIATTAKYELLAEVLDFKDAGYRVTIEYRKNLFSRSAIKRMLNHFVTLLKSIARNPSEKVSKLNFVTEAEKELITNKWNDTYRDIPTQTIHELFERQAADNPKREALSYNDKVLTYQELNIRANQLAHHLMDNGVTTGDLVGVLMNETEEAIISFLAILKAGGAYVPLDPAYPMERLAYMLENSKAKIVITYEKLRAKLVPYGSVSTILLDVDGPMIFKGDQTNPEKAVFRDDLAYVIYTSGSTGKPKGVAIEHRGVVRMFFNTDWITFNSRTRVLKTAAFAFDVSVMEIWGTLMLGGRLFLYSKDDLLDPQFLKQKLAEEKINFLFIASSWLNQLIEVDPTIFYPLKTLMSGGDKLSAKHINKLMSVNPDLEVINAYGPTENSVWSTSCRLSGEQFEPMPIGKPIPNSTAYIMDESLQILPIGVIGEICVGGAGVARGYVNNEAKTRDRFVDDPFNPGQKLYKTGDLGRWLEDGTIEFHGRNDNQIKLRGYRIELGEIEHAVVEHSKIDQCAVIVSGSDEKDKMLVCFYTGSEEIQHSDLKGFLKETLPDYMIPMKFVRLEKLPMTPNGKTNRLALQTSSN
jgi:amino acid adenylation domain-containing protein